MFVQLKRMRSELEAPKGLVFLEVQGVRLTLHPDRAMFWPAKSLLILADLHLGKIQHFRNSGIYLPKIASFDNYERLSGLLLEFLPDTLMIMGDLFHSKYNQDWINFCELRNTFPDVHFKLIPGNHDILDSELFIKNDVDLYKDGMTLDHFHFSHHPIETPGLYNFAGHIHPGIRLVGEGLQSLRLPAFYFGVKQALLPSFGTFTGMSLIKPEKGDQVVVISEDGLVNVSI